MNALSPTTIWLAIALLGVGTFAIRFSFLALASGRPLPEWAMRLLRYVPTSVLPALVAPMVVWPPATNGELDPARLAAAITALAVGALWRNVLAAIGAGLAVLFGLLALGF
ncbi:MAG: AzlD domain-containing protein [Pseudomonadales bacterium]|jgi:branched-subunit amino acid transport protein|nr:AzlD domain-containing protein [Pseudomonadales bacterium]